MSRFCITSATLQGLKVIQRESRGDDRGFFSRLFCMEELLAAGWHKPIAQINHSYTAHEGTVRGLHYQRNPYEEMKLVSCIRGKIWDVAIDLRKESPTFLHWEGQVLSAENRNALLIPEGFAHGFQALTDDVELVYVHSAAYHPSAEAGLNPEDPTLNIDWPIPIAKISTRDKQLPLVSDNREFDHS